MSKINSKGLYIGDPHFLDASVPNRKDVYIDAISLKFTEALEIARDRELDYVVILGDLFNSAEPTGLVRNRVIEILLKGNNAKRWPFEIFLVAGNHDIYGHNIKTIEKTAIKTLETVGLITICDYSEKYGIYFGHYKHNIEAEEINTDCPILAMHSNILPNFFYNSILIDDFKTNNKNKLVISGHYHPGYDIIKKENGIYFANPGSLGRISSSDAKHKVQVALVEMEDGEISNLEYLPLQKALAADQIFEMQTIIDNKKDKVNIEEFINSINVAKSTINKDSDIISNIKQFGEENKIDPEIIEEAIKRVLNMSKTARKEDDNNDE